jgi:hypothetical protein
MNDKMITINPSVILHESGSHYVCTYYGNYSQFPTFEEAEEALKKCIEEYQRTRNPDRVVKTYEIK